MGAIYGGFPQGCYRAVRRHRRPCGQEAVPISDEHRFAGLRLPAGMPASSAPVGEQAIPRDAAEPCAPANPGYRAASMLSLAPGWQSFGVWPHYTLANHHTMNSTPSPISLALCLLVSFVLVGCSTTTTVKLTGTPGTQVTGHYRATQVSSDFSGTPAWQMEFANQQLEEFEFQKTALEQSVALEIRRGRKVLVQATAEPGMRGLRVRHADGWRVEALE